MNKKQTSPEMAKLASGVLRDGKQKAITKKLAGSVLSQAGSKPKGKK